MNNILFSIIVSLSILFFSTSSFAAKFSTHKEYSKFIAECSQTFGNKISIEKSICLNEASIKLAKQVNYPNMDLVLNANRQRIELTKKVLNDEMSEAQMRFKMKRIYNDMQRITEYENNNEGYFLVSHD